jgi:hypothetical protein
MADVVFPMRDGLAAVRAADAIRNLLESPELSTRRYRMARHNPYAPRTAGTARRSPGKPTEVVTVERAGGRLQNDVLGDLLAETPFIVEIEHADKQGSAVLTDGGTPAPLPDEAGTTIESIVDWVGDDPHRARWALSAETQHYQPRWELLAVLRAVADGAFPPLPSEAGTTGDSIIEWVDCDPTRARWALAHIEDFNPTRGVLVALAALTERVPTAES